MKKIFLGILALILIVAGVVLFNTFNFKSRQYTVKASPAPDVAPEALSRFQEALRFQTISFADSAKFDSSQFNGFHRFLERAYPSVHGKMTRIKLSGYTLLYKWEGADTTQKPYVLMAHQDVVPIEEASRQMWTVEPFGGVVKENYIWGRGTADDKINLIGIMEAAEKLIKENYQPTRTIYLVFGHDEEVGGYGARAVVKWMKENSVEAELVLDEGGVVTKEKIPGLDKPVALIGTAEKGYLSVDVVAEKSGGHSSMPDAETSIDILNRALIKLRDNPFEPRLTDPMVGFIEMLGPEMPFVQRMAFANQWLFKGAIFDTYSQSGSGNAMIRTTLVPTILQAGIKDNVIPTIAQATVNLRLLPGDQSTDAIARMNSIINDPRVKVTPKGTPGEASQITPRDSQGFKKVEAVIKQSVPGILSSSFMMIGATDSRYFGDVSPNIIKFSPMVDPIGFHGIDERVSVESFQTTLWFFENLMRNAN